ncbi:MAG: CBS domain-containing protein [Gemmatimonadota bacterium]|nr:CBS domain-containing protein [Gemmatimonadota bacterium]MDH3422045.1 CBS domain-containing protein [Gemmatimonadota bacterium]
MNVGDILHSKGSDVVTIDGAKTVLDAVQVLVERNIGSLVVVEGQRLTGIITERDILRVTSRAPGELGALAVGEVMTQEVITSGPGAELSAVMDVMSENKVRHLPITEGDRLVGIISIGDVVNACRVSAEEENSQLRQYIQGSG